MHRPCFLVIDREFPGSISTRKLVIETAKFNVITAYSGKEALHTLVRFPKIDGIVLDLNLEDIPCKHLVRQMKQARPDLPIIVIETIVTDHCDGADFYFSSFEPANLLKTLSSLQPEGARQVEESEEQAKREQA